MKNFFLSLMATIVMQVSLAQNVGIGTTTPNAKAALEINSTNKGLLIPTMTTSQLYAISTPPNGLLVYNSTLNELYQYNGTSWKAILNGNYWSRPITSRKKITNSLDSVGIGTNSPTEWLDVDGNIRSRNNVIADNNVNATGTVSGAALASTGTATIIGTSILYGDVSTYNNITMNGTDQTFQLKNAGNDKGFMQLSGDDFRIGINSANTSGRFVIRTGGANRLYVDDGGNVSINTSSVAAGYKLNIKGKAICEELKVQLSGSWPDYVFEKDYGLRSLSELKSFIELNKHLPDIPPASEIELNGFEIGDMQKRLTQKVEELTLYIIQLKEEIDLLKEKK